MYELIRTNQLDIMLILCGACGILVFLLINTRFLSQTRKRILILMELMALFLLWFDRLAYIYAGVPGTKAYIMVRVSNFIVFFLTSAIVLGFNLYLSDLLRNEGRLEILPRRLFVTSFLSVTGMVLAVYSAYTGLYYYFDRNNLYHRGRGFIIAYIFPILSTIIQYSVVRKYKKSFSRLIYASLVLYLIVPVMCGILQIFAYGISIVNMSMVTVSVFLYLFMYLDLNNEVEYAHEMEIEKMQGEHERMQRLFHQTATAFVSAVEKKDDFTKGNSIRIAEYAKKIAEMSGRDEEFAEKVYYAALLHDVGMIGIPDKVIKNEKDPKKWDYDVMRQKPLIGEEILSSITEYPYLREGARYSHERYNGTGYPDGLAGDQIPEIARIIAVADAFVTMTTKKRYRDARPRFVARETFIKGGGDEFDPEFADIMVKIIDNESKDHPADYVRVLEKEITCREYREQVSTGISVESVIKRISFECEDISENSEDFSAPSIVLFDSYDQMVHDDEKSIGSYHYLEYGEIWFDKNSICTAARKMEDHMLEEGEADTLGSGYEIIAGRYEDHLKLILKGNGCKKEVIIAIHSVSNATYIGLTGENCRIYDISAVPTGDTVVIGDIPRIAERINYLDHLEADLPNIQIDRPRAGYTDGIEIKGRVRISFHTMSYPGANLIWHCPYIILFNSSDGKVNGENYEEYQMLKINGEDDTDERPYDNKFSMKKGSSFPGWESWKERNKQGLECVVEAERKGNTVTVRSENLGISIENILTVTDDMPGKVYVALSGDQVALTDIRIG